MKKIFKLYPDLIMVVEIILALVVVLGFALSLTFLIGYVGVFPGLIKDHSLLELLLGFMIIVVSPSLAALISLWLLRKTENIENSILWDEFVDVTKD